MSLVVICALLSLDVARGLVSRGMGLGYDAATAAAAPGGVGRFAPGFPPLAIVDATNTNPIVVTTASPHGVSPRGIGGMSCIVSGVLGNVAANNIDLGSRSRTRGLNAGVLAVPTGPTTLALYGQDSDDTSPTNGALIPIAGTGAYAGGGTIVPALTDGSILVGREMTRENSAPPRIVMIPSRVPEWPSRTGSLPNPQRNSERQTQIRQRSIRTEVHEFEIHVWGQSTPPNVALDFDVTQALYQQIIDSTYLLVGQQHRLSPGRWDDEGERKAQHVRAGHLFSFGLAVSLPVLDNPIPGGLPFVPAGSEMDVTVESFTPEVAAVFDLPLTPG